jgi:acetate kinase
MDAIVVVNCGSSSVKLDVFDSEVRQALLSASVERVGTDAAQLSVTMPATKEQAAQEHVEPLAGADHTRAVAALLAAVAARGFTVQAVGHRVVHGGEKLTEAVVVDDAVVAGIEACVPLAPLHNPGNLAGLRAAQQALPGVRHIAVFDTGFHGTLAPEAYLYALPRRFHVEDGIRRYGFHGTSHRYVAERAAAFFARPLASLKLVTLHLGNGCSACAIDGGRSVDTTMGMTPLEGLMMGTRSGDIDPAVVLRLARKLGVDEAEMLLNKQSGLLGVSGSSHDMRDLIEAAAAGDADADLAVRMFARRVKKAVGAMAGALGGLDAIVFTGGIGENSSRVRALVCDGLRVVGALLHEKKNDARSSAERDLSTMDSRVRILVIPTDEERAIARETARLASSTATGAAAAITTPASTTASSTTASTTTEASATTTSATAASATPLRTKEPV